MCLEMEANNPLQKVKELVGDTLVFTQVTDISVEDEKVENVDEYEECELALDETSILPGSTYIFLTEFTG